MKDYIKMMLEAEQLKFLVFAHHLTMLQACTEAVIEAKVTVQTSAQLLNMLNTGLWTSADDL